MTIVELPSVNCVGASCYGPKLVSSTFNSNGEFFAAQTNNLQYFFALLKKCGEVNKVWIPGKQVLAARIDYSLEIGDMVVIVIFVVGTFGAIKPFGRQQQLTL